MHSPRVCYRVWSIPTTVVKGSIPGRPHPPHSPTPPTLPSTLQPQRCINHTRGKTALPPPPTLPQYQAPHLQYEVWQP